MKFVDMRTFALAAAVAAAGALAGAQGGDLTDLLTPDDVMLRRPAKARAASASEAQAGAEARKAHEDVERRFREAKAAAEAEAKRAEAEKRSAQAAAALAEAERKSAREAAALAEAERKSVSEAAAAAAAKSAEEKARQDAELKRIQAELVAVKARMEAEKNARAQAEAAAKKAEAEKQSAVAVAEKAEAEAKKAEAEKQSAVAVAEKAAADAKKAEAEKRSAMAVAEKAAADAEKAEAEKKFALEGKAAAEKKAERLANPEPDERPAAKPARLKAEAGVDVTEAGKAAVAVEKKGRAKAKGDAGRSAVITADRTDYGRKEGVILFDRNVFVDDEQYKMHADRLFVFLDGTNDLKRLVALGSVAITNEQRTASCARAVYTKSAQRIVMYGDANAPAVLRDGGGKKDGSSTVRGQRITYWLDTGMATVEKPVIEMPALKGANSPKELFGIGGGKDE